MSAPTKPAHLLRDEPHHERGHVVICICGWIKAHPRAKVRVAAGNRHLAKASTGPGGAA